MVRFRNVARKYTVRTDEHELGKVCALFSFKPSWIPDALEADVFRIAKYAAEMPRNEQSSSVL